MNPLVLMQLAASTLVFVLAAASAKSWALAPSLAKIAVTLALYTLGNLIMLRLIRSLGMATAFSISAVVQLLAVNVIAIVMFGERLGWIESVGVALAIVSVALITLGPALSAP
jgi:multidrug transporter EmrE-like cation transporter